MFKIKIEVDDDALGVEQILAPNIYSFYIHLLDDSKPLGQKVVNVTLIGISNNQFEKMHELDGSWEVMDLNDNYEILKFYDIIDILNYNLYEHSSEFSIQIPIKWKASYQSIYGNLRIVGSRQPKKVAVVGMKHSGSTLLWNILKIAYKNLGFPENHVSKNHTPGQDMKDNYVIITTYRDVRDTAISGFLRFFFQKSYNETDDMQYEIQNFGLHKFINYMHENITIFYDSLQGKNVNLYKYEDYKSNPVEYITNLFEYLNIYNDVDFVKKTIREAEEIKEDENLEKNLNEYQKNLFNRPQLLTKDHNTSGGRSEKYKDFFTKEQNDYILRDRRIHHFLSKYKYI